MNFTWLVSVVNLNFGVCTMLCKGFEKVYSFQLCEDNPHEAQAREVNEAWVGERYSLRHVVVEALLASKVEKLELDGLHSILEQIQEMILSLGKHPAIGNRLTTAN